MAYSDHRQIVGEVGHAPGTSTDRPIGHGMRVHDGRQAQKRLGRMALLAGLSSAALAAHAHHAFTSTFDVGRSIEIEGRITALAWQNPHVLMTLEAADGTVFEVESQAKNLLERTGVDPSMFAPGTRVALAGYPARRGNGIFALNALLPTGAEVILRAGIPPHFGVERVGEPENILRGGVADRTAEGASLFRVWSMQFAGEGRWRWPAEYPLTDEAAAGRASFDPIADNPLANCGRKGMPWIMEQPFPVQFEAGDGVIVLRLEEEDAMRVIHMDAAPADSVAPSPLGYSVGHWEGTALVVRTTHIDYPYLNATGIPITNGIVLDERFEVAPDGSRLDYRLSITDPATFTMPVTVESYWVWRPGERLQSYDCVAEQ